MLLTRGLGETVVRETGPSLLPAQFFQGLASWANPLGALRALPDLGTLSPAALAGYVVPPVALLYLLARSSRSSRSQARR